jgi:hypothetical protein
MELNTLTSRRADPFHDKLRLTDEFIAGVTRLTSTSSTPNARDTVLRKSTIGEFASDQETKGVWVHGTRLWADIGPVGASQIHQGLGTTTPTQKPRCRRMKVSTPPMI